MAKKNIERFYTSIKQEGENGATRGKISAAMAVSMGAKDGSMIEWEVQNGTCVGGRVMSKGEVKELEREKARDAKESKRSVAKSTKKGKGKAKPAKPEVKPSKSNKRKTKVSFDTDEAPRKKTKKGKFKKLKRRS